MAQLQDLPNEILDSIIELLVVAIGIQKAVLLRTVNQRFDAAIMQAICVSQVISMDDPATPSLANRMAPKMRGKIIAARSRSSGAASKSYLGVVAKVNSILDDMIDDSNELARSRHEAIAAAVDIGSDASVNDRMEIQNLLCGAAITGSLSVVSSVLECNSVCDQPVDVSAGTPYFQDPLSLAAARGYLDIVTYLLSRGASADLTFCHCNGQRSTAEVAEWILQESKKVRRDTVRCQSPNPLRFAVRGGHEDIVHLLLRPENQFPFGCVRYEGALLAGAEAGRLDLINLILKTTGKGLTGFPGLGKELMWEAVRHDQKDVVQALLCVGVDINDTRRPDTGTYSSALQLAASLGRLSMVHFLLERGAAVNNIRLRRTEDLPVAAAARAGHEEVVWLLLERGAEPSEALRYAAKGAQPRLLRSLLPRFPGLLSTENGDLEFAVLCSVLRAGNLTALTVLVEAGFPINEFHEDPWNLPMNLAKQVFAPWARQHLISLGAYDTKEEPTHKVTECTVRGVRISERTWEWVSKY